tara:strand:- start:829 stop:996 length:168 start_codon:yes stop_codon:yes gene_type:complete
MEEKNPKPLQVFYDKIHNEKSSYAFVFSTDINDWIHSRQRKYDEKGRRKKANKNK